MSRDAEGMVAEAKRLSNAVPGIVVKIPVTAEGLAAIKLLKKKASRRWVPRSIAPRRGCWQRWRAQNMLPLTSTASMPVGRRDSHGAGAAIPAGAARARSKVLAASFKTPRQALDCLLTGCEAITLPLDVAQHMLGTPAVESAIEKFEQDWNNAFGNLNL